LKFGVNVRLPGAIDQDVAAVSNGPEEKPAFPVVASTAIPVVPTPVVKLTVVDDAVPNVVMDCAEALLDPTIAANITNPIDMKNFLIIYSPQTFST
jgi:hypothetical protein